MRLLLMTHRLPYAPNRGDRIRAYHLLRELSRHFEVDVISLVHDDEEAAQVSALKPAAATVITARTQSWRGAARTAAGLLTGTPATHTMLNSADLRGLLRTHVQMRPPDVVLAYCSGIAHLAFEPGLRSVPLVVDMVDVDSLKWSALAQKSVPPKSWIYARESRLLAEFEREISRRAVITLVATEAERIALRQIAETDRIEVIENGIDLEAFRPVSDPTPSQRVVFCGVMNYAPNVEAAVWLAERVWPEVRRVRPKAVLQIVGASPSRAVRDLASEPLGIEVTGTVADVRPYLWGAAVAAAPLFVARGIQNKVLEAVAAGLPVVLTSIVADPLPAAVRPACLVADDTASFAGKLVEALDRPVQARTKLIEEMDLAPLNWSTRLAGLADMIRTAGRT